MNTTPINIDWCCIHKCCILSVLFLITFSVFSQKSRQSDSSTTPIKLKFLNPGSAQITSLQGLAYYNIADSVGKRSWLAYDVGTSIFTDFFVLKRFALGTGIAYYFSKYHYTYDRANLNFHGYLKYYPKFGNTNAKLKFLTNNFFLLLGFGQGHVYLTPLNKTIFARNKSLYTGFGFSVVPLKLFKRNNFHWGFDFMWYTPTIYTFKNHLPANPGGVGVKYFL